MQLLANGKQQFIDQNGAPLAGGFVYHYAPGTTNPVTTYKDQAGNSANTNPIQLDSRGQAVIWGTGSYRQVVQDAQGNAIWDQVVTAPDVNAPANSLSTQLLSFLGSSLMGFLQAGIGFVVRTVQDKLREVVSITDAMSPAQIADVASATPTIDLTAVLQAVHDALPARGGEIVMPPGTYIINGVTFTKAVKLRGYGSRTTIIRTTSPTANVLNLTGFGSCVQNIGFEASVVRTAGAFLKVAAAWYSSVTDVGFAKFYLGIDIDNCVGVNVRNVYGIDGVAGSVAANGALIRIGETSYCGNINIDGVVADVNDTTKQPSFGILLRFLDVGTVKNALIIHHTSNLKLAPHSGQFVAQTFFHGNSFDTATTGIDIQPETGGMVLRCGFDSSWAGQNSGDGLRINGINGIVDGVTFNAMQFISNAGINVNIIGSKTKNIFFGGACRSAGGGGNGLQLTSNCNAVWDGGVIGATDVAAGNATLGVAVEAGCSGALRNCNLAGNVGGPINNASPVLFIESGNSPHDWTAFAPVLSAAGGSVTGAAIMRYKRNGKTVMFTCTVTISASAGTGYIKVTTPFTSGPLSQMFCGRETVVTGKQLQALSLPNDTNILIYNSDGTYPGAAGVTLVISGVLETA